jgi:hypothetical protein
MGFHGKLPRHYAAEFLKAKDKDSQKLALQGCPQEWQELVKTHIKIKRMRESHDNTNKNHK